MNIFIDRILAVENGEEAEISIALSNGKESQQIKGRVSASMFSELGLPLVMKEPLSIGKDRCEEILRCMKLYAAIKKGICLLGYASNTEKALTRKLKLKGYPDEIAAQAASYLKEKGYIREEDDALRYAENLALHKSYGKNRIKKEMYAKGFPENVIRRTLDLTQVDFAEVCACRIRSMGGVGILKNTEEKNKAVSALIRYGFSYHEIREAAELLQNEDE